MYVREGCHRPVVILTYNHYDSNRSLGMAITIPDTKVTRSTVYKEAGDARYEEAKYLADDHPSGAIYLAGYYHNL